MHRVIVLMVICATVWGCATAPVQNQKQATDMPLPIIETQQDALSDVGKILAEFKSTNDERRLQQSVITLAEQYQSQADCLSSNHVIKYALQLVTNVELLTKANIMRSECAILDIEQQPNNIQLAGELSKLETEVTVSRIASWLVNTDTNSIDKNWMARQIAVAAYVQAAQSEYYKALDILLRTETSSSILAPLLPKLTFDWLGRLAHRERMDIIESHPQLFRYQRLFSIIEDASITDFQRQQQLVSLIENASTEGEFKHLPEQVSLFLSLEVTKHQQTAVLLPLSGRLASQGDAIKQGILASYYQQLSRQLKPDTSVLTGEYNEANGVAQFSFIDTGSENELPETINLESMQKYSAVIGPLLKSHIEESQSIIPKTVLRIYLNQLDTNVLGISENTQLVNFFALSPEQEAQELAKQMRSQYIKHPVLIYNDSAVTKRMVDAFLDTWQQQNSDNAIAPSQVKYADNKSMRVGITSALDVLQSQQRINQLSNLVGETVFSVTRNRRDVDAFVVFARPNEVELINPIIESSMSLFTGQQIPVYATSLSYNHKQNKNSLRDLRNLVFVDMPFIMPDGRETMLAKEVDTLFNEPSSTYLRLFAFGYDAVSLSQQILKLRVFNQISINGLSGILSTDRNGNVERELSTLSIDAGS